jgi:uncharacterized protein YjbI with pentapeptide repeats
MVLLRSRGRGKQEMAFDAKDLGEIQKALNEAAGKASLLWATFVTLELYVLIATGSVTHRDLLLASPIKLPLLNVDLPLVGFFLATPIILVVLHFYVLLQLVAFAQKSRDYEFLLKDQVPNVTERRYLRQRLDPFFILQFLAGPSRQRAGFNGFWLRLIAWITLVGAPVLILLQLQTSFLPFHLEPVTWIHRSVLAFDLFAIWSYWHELRASDRPFIPFIKDRFWIFSGGLLSLCVLGFSVTVATFPGEKIDVLLPDIDVLPFGVTGDDDGSISWTSLHNLLFAGDRSEITDRRRSLLANNLILTDQSFVEPDKLEKMAISLSLRGRDLTHGVFNRSDFRKADFTGARLDGASFDSSKLQQAHLGCVDEWCTSLEKVNALRVNLDGSDLSGAKLKGAYFAGASLKGANLDLADLRGAHFHSAQLQGVGLRNSDLRGVDFGGSWLQAADLSWAKLQGANLKGTHLEGANLKNADLAGANLYRARLQGAGLAAAKFEGSILVGAFVWRSWGGPFIHLSDLRRIEMRAKPWEEYENLSFEAWRDAVIEGILDDRSIVERRLSTLNPDTKDEVIGKSLQKIWPERPGREYKASILTEELWQTKDTTDESSIEDVLVRKICEDDSGQYIADGIASYLGDFVRWAGVQPEPEIAARLKAVIAKVREWRLNTSTCRNVGILGDEFWTWSDRLLEKPN